jgi:hypothetical protein
LPNWGSPGTERASTGDELYFFGFSRGAFTVRTLAGFMNAVGLIEKDDDYFIPDIYGCYESNARPGLPEWTHAFRKVRGTRPWAPSGTHATVSRAPAIARPIAQ